jgi:hypothetical protein
MERAAKTASSTQFSFYRSRSLRAVDDASSPTRARTEIVVADQYRGFTLHA